MIASTLAKQLDTIEVKLPLAKKETENRRSIAVTINANNRYFIDGKRVAKAAMKGQLLSTLKAQEESCYCASCTKECSH